MRESNFKNFGTSILTACLLALTSFSAASAQSNFSDQVVLDLLGGKTISFQPETVSTKPNTAPNFSFKNLKQQAIITRENRIHRVLFDEANNVLFGYNIVIENADKPNALNVSFQPLVPETAETLRRELFPNAVSNGSKMRVLTLARTTSMQSLLDGATISLDLLTSRQLGLKITDQLRFAVKNNVEVPVRDFSLDDFELAMSDSTLTKNGEVLGETAATRKISGSLLWFYLPNEGLYVFSLTPREGYNFRKTGKVYGNNLEFTDKGKNFRWTSSENVLNIDGAYSIWVLNEPNFIPAAVSFSAPNDSKTRKKPANEVETKDLLKTLDTNRARFGTLEKISRLLQPIFLLWRENPSANNNLRIYNFAPTSEESKPAQKVEIITDQTIDFSSPFRMPRLKSGATTRIENILPKQ